MPELPEAETIARVLDERLSGQPLISVLQHAAPHDPWQKLSRGITGLVLKRVWRHGKCVILDFERMAASENQQLTPGAALAPRLIVRLGMTGTLTIRKERGPYTLAAFTFARDQLLYDDIRRFGRLVWTSEMPHGLGPDALAITADQFAARLAQRSRHIKALLLDQSFIAGLGNIYADECLFRAHIHPMALANRVDATMLHRAIVETLKEAIDCGGSSIRDFIDPLGRKGRFQERHRVYARQGQPCPNCGQLIRRTLTAQRGTHFCPSCQKRPRKG